MNTFKKRAVAITLACSFFLVGCSSTSPETPKPVGNNEPTASESTNAETISVAIEGFKYVPNNLNVKRGTTVVWTNKDAAPHTVTSDEGTLDSDDLAQGDTFSYTFDTAGVFNYICAIHPSMKGTVTVQ